MQKPLLNFYWIKDRPWRLLAFGFGSGLSRYAPGTVGTLWAWVIGLGFPLAFPNSLESEIIFLLFVDFNLTTLTQQHVQELLQKKE